MPFDPADKARCIVKYDMPNNVEAQSRFTAAWNGTSQLADATALNNWASYLDDIFSVVSADISSVVTIPEFELYRVLEIGGEEVLEFIGFGTVSNQPSNPSEMAPHGVCMLFSSRLTGIGRGTAKKFFPGFTEAALVNGIWDAAVIANMAPALADWAANFGSGNDWLPGTFSIAKGFRGLALPVARSTPAYQTRRKPGVGS